MLKKFILCAHLFYKFGITHGADVPKEASQRELNFKFLEFYEGADNNSKLFDESGMHVDKVCKKHVETIASLIKKRSNLGKSKEIYKEPIFRGNENIYGKKTPFCIQNFLVVMEIRGTDEGNYRLHIPLDVLVINNPFEGYKFGRKTISLVILTTKGYFFLEYSAPGAGKKNHYQGIGTEGMVVGFIDNTSGEIFYTKQHYPPKDDEKKIVMKVHFPKTDDFDLATRSLIRVMRSKIFAAEESNENNFSKKKLQNAGIKNDKSGKDSASSSRQGSMSQNDKLKGKENYPLEHDKSEIIPAISKSFKKLNSSQRTSAPLKTRPGASSPGLDETPSHSKRPSRHNSFENRSLSGKMLRVPSSKSYSGLLGQEKPDKNSPRRILNSTDNRAMFDQEKPSIKSLNSVSENSENPENQKQENKNSRNILSDLSDNVLFPDEKVPSEATLSKSTKKDGNKNKHSRRLSMADLEASDLPSTTKYTTKVTTSVELAPAEQGGPSTLTQTDISRNKIEPFEPSGHLRWFKSRGKKLLPSKKNKQ